MPAVDRFFDALFHPWMRSRLRVHVAGLPNVSSDVPWIYCANHESWWDGFLIRSIHRRLQPHAPFKAVMLSSELETRPLLRALGAVGIEPGSVASGRRLLRSLAAAPRSVGVAFFPQGRIRPDAPSPLGFQRGIEHVARALAPAMLLPVALRILPGRDHRMDAFVSVGAPMSVPEGRAPGVAEVEAAVAEELDAIGGFVRSFEEDAAAMWPNAAGLLPRRPRVPWLDAGPLSRN